MTTYVWTQWHRIEDDLRVRFQTRWTGKNQTVRSAERLAGIKHPKLSRWLRREVTLSPDEIASLATVMGMTPQVCIDEGRSAGPSSTVTAVRMLQDRSPSS
ncbi:MAG: helix-turn-helix transcriptional regulator [Phycisphaeraceae bacterium]|nr:helix-turn-helix transcriptional regulator [Phycisphaerales bacterium]MCB9858868.1 helix-turn-helix transcriptional regulator [Phycisphaeraceae bacterium]